MSGVNDNADYLTLTSVLADNRIAMALGRKRTF
jgi:hypothetical protein